MNRRFAAKDHHRAGALLQGGDGPFNQQIQAQWRALERFQLGPPVMQKSQRRSQPLKAIAKVGINSNSSDTSVCAENTRASAPAWQRPAGPANRSTPH
jgi:hypothetical protein